MQLKAQKDEKPESPPAAVTRTSKLDEKYLLKDNTENVIRAKLDRIGYNSRVTPTELAQKKVLSRPEQAEIDTYNARLRELGKEANANLAAEIPPSLDVPQTEAEWCDIDESTFGLAILESQRAEFDGMIEAQRKLIADIERRTQPNHTPTKENKRVKSNAERDLRGLVTSLKQTDKAIEVVKENRRAYIEQAQVEYQEEMENYIEQISVLTSKGLSTQRDTERYLDTFAKNVDHLLVLSTNLLHLSLVSNLLHHNSRAKSEIVDDSADFARELDGDEDENDGEDCCIYSNHPV
eukprot:scaffold7211_cov247-Ochromonas_danica.AAC.18